MNRKVLVIGGMGFIGQYLVRACCEAGMTVRVADIVAPVIDAAERDVEYLQGDYRDEVFLHRIIDGVNMVVHLAHDTILLDLNCNIESEFNRNILPAVRLMDACHASGVAKFLFVSSGGTLYGNYEPHEPITEDAQKRPISVYGISKLIIEQLGFLYYEQKKLPFIAARPGNAYGQGQLPFRGQGFIATALASALQYKTLNIFGDGSVVRDYVHAQDIADALVALLKQGRIGEAYNIGTARGTSLRTLIDDCIVPIISDEGYALICNFEPERRADVIYNVLANDKLRVDTGFCPRIALGEGIRSTWQWLKKINSFEDKKYQ